MSSIVHKWQSGGRRLWQRYLSRMPGRRKFAWARQRAAMLAAVLIFAVLGAAIIFKSHAASTAVSLEAEDGTASAGAKPVTDGTASGGQAIAFSSGITAPPGLRTVTGGPSIAVLWDPIATADSGISYTVYRDGAPIATTTPGPANGPAVYQKGARYIDASITPGATYRYQVQANDNGAGSPLSNAISVTAPANTTPTPTITTDTTEAPDMANWLNNTVVPEIKTWYPKVADQIAYPSYTPRQSFTVYLKTEADVGNNRAITHFDTGEIDLNADYFRGDPSDIGVAIHESTHVIQGYVTKPWPYWVQEGMADWAEFYVYQDFDNPLPNGQYDTYTQGYHPAAYFLQWLQQNSSAGFMKNLNTTMRSGSYTPGFITTQTGKTPDQQWTAMTGHAISTGAVSAASYAHICVDDTDSVNADGNKVQIYTCNNTGAQTWSILPQSNGNSTIEAFGSCLDASHSGKVDGTPVDIWGCNGSAAQGWKINSNKTITNVNSGKCLYNSGGATSGTQLILQTCDASDPGQLWNTP